MGTASIAHENLAQALREQGFVVTPIKGTSMLPLLRQEKDTVVVVPAEPSQVEPMDVVLFHDRQRDRYVLHRLIAKDADTLTTLGDNCTSCERFPREWLLGRLSSVYRGERELPLDSPAYRAYVTLWCRPWQARMRGLGLYRRTRHRVGQALRALGLRRPA